MDITTICHNPVTRMIALAEMSRGLACGRFILKIASTDRELEAVFRLRYRVFNEELGEGLPENVALGLDVDEFDRHCDHLMLIDHHILDNAGIEAATVGTYRLLHGPRRPARGFYTETEFDLSRVVFDRDATVELGRGCIAAAHRKQTTLMALFWGLHRYMRLRQSRYLIGCGSLPMMGPDDASATFAAMQSDGVVDPALPATPHPANLHLGDAAKGRAQIPPLLKLYFQFGARVLGKPAYDWAFKCHDVPVLLDHDRLTEWGRDLLSRFDARIQDS